jgi:hypothetical protein
MNESPAFQKMKAEGKTSKAPLTESFGQWRNLKIVILALFGLTGPGRGLVHRPVLRPVLPDRPLKVDGATANILMAASLLIGTPFFVVFGACPTRSAASRSSWPAACWPSLTYFPVFKALTKAANPDLHAAQQSAKCR